MSSIYSQLNFLLHQPFPILIAGLLIGAGIARAVRGSIDAHVVRLRQYYVYSQLLALTACVLWAALSHHQVDIGFAIAMAWAGTGAWAILSHSAMIAMIVRLTKPRTIREGRYGFTISLLLTACLWGPLLVSKLVCTGNSQVTESQ